MLIRIRGWAINANSVSRVGPAGYVKQYMGFTIYQTDGSESLITGYNDMDSAEKARNMFIEQCNVEMSKGNEVAEAILTVGERALQDKWHQSVEQ